MIRTGKIALEYQIPIFQGGRISGAVHEQEAVVGQAQVHLSDLREQITADVTTAIAALQSGEAQQTMAREQLTLAEEELREARLRFGNGIAGNIEVVNAQSSLIRARDALIQAMANTALARVQLARAVGVTTTVH
jgi:outer membrane protein TolC